MAEAWVSVARAAAIRQRLQEVIEDLAQPSAGQSSGTVQVSVLIGYFSPESSHA